MGLREYVPAYHGQESQDGVEFMKLENLLSRFGQCCAMDCKLGTRTFLEKDASSTKIRADLLAKMDKVDPTEATAEERQAGGITKLRYMHFREKAGSTQSLGFRIEAMKVDGVKTKDFKTVSTEDQVRVHFAQFLQGRQDILAVFLKRLEAFRRDLLKSEFFPCHEVSVALGWAAAGRLGWAYAVRSQLPTLSAPAHNVHTHARSRPRPCTDCRELPAVCF